MVSRIPADQRREQIVEAALDLLGRHPLSDVTTRRIAREVGITQPGLFRHFRSRDDIVLAAVDLLRERLGAIAAEAVDPSRPPLHALSGLVRALLRIAATHPGMPRLLFQDVGSGTPFHAPLSHLVSMQLALFEALTAGAADAGALPTDTEAHHAARLLLALVQGTLLQRQLDTSPPTDADADAIFALWTAGLRAGALPAALPDSAGAPAPPPAATTPLLVLDVHPVLAAGTDPLAAILSALARIEDDGLLCVFAPFRPAPLLALLRGKGLTVIDEPAAGGFAVLVQPPGAASPLDLRDLPAPEPLEGVLEAAEALAPGAALVARTPRPPHLLAEQLDERGFDWVIAEHPDGSGLVHVRAPVSGGTPISGAA